MVGRLIISNLTLYTYPDPSKETLAPTEGIESSQNKQTPRTYISIMCAAFFLFPNQVAPLQRLKAGNLKSTSMIQSTW